MQKLLRNLNRSSISSSNFGRRGAGQCFASTGCGAEQQQSQKSNPRAPSSTPSPPPLNTGSHQCNSLHYLTFILDLYSKSSNLQETTCFYYGGPKCKNLAIASHSWLREIPFDKSPNDSISAFSIPHLT